MSIDPCADLSILCLCLYVCEFAMFSYLYTHICVYSCVFLLPCVSYYFYERYFWYELHKFNHVFIVNQIQQTPVNKILLVLEKYIRLPMHCVHILILWGPSYFGSRNWFMLLPPLKSVYLHFHVVWAVFGFGNLHLYFTKLTCISSLLGVASDIVCMMILLLCYI